jgi:hypothetical protein
MDYVYLTPKIITATFVFTLIQSSKLKDPIFQIGLFSIIYYLTGTYGLGYEMNWKEIMVATLLCGALLRSKLKVPVKLLLFVTLLSLARPLCYLS